MLSPRAQLEQGVRFERAGSMRLAMESYQAVGEAVAEPDLVAEALRRQADVYRISCDWNAALAAARKSADVAKNASRAELFAEALNSEAAIHQSLGDFGAAVPLFMEVLASTRDPRIRGNALQNLGSIAAMERRFEQAKQYFQESRRCFQRAGYRRGEVIALTNASGVANDLQEFEQAEALAREAMAGAKQLEDFEALAHASLNYATARAGRKSFAQAEELFSTAFGYFAIERNTYRQATCLRLLGDLSREQGSAANAIRCYEHGLKLAQEVGAKVEAARLRERLAQLDTTPTTDALESL